MKYNLSDTHTLWQENVLVGSPIFNKKASGFLTAYDKESEVSSAKDIGNALDSGPDGALFWLPNVEGLKESFIEFATDYWKKAFLEDNLNFDNGGVAETLFFHDFPQGTLVEMVDPECGTSIFDEVINEFLKKEKKAPRMGKNLKTIYYHEDCHMDSNWDREMDNRELKKLLKSYAK